MVRDPDPGQREPADATAERAGWASRIARGLRSPQLPRLPALLRWTSPVAAAVFAAAVQYAVLPRPAIAPFVFFYPTIALASWAAGRRAGLLAVLLSAAVANYFFLPPHEAFSFERAELKATVLFLVGASGVALLCASFRDALIDAERSAEVQRRQAELLRLSHDAILVWRLDAGLETWNRGAEELYGFRLDEARGRVAHDLLQTRSARPRAEIEAELRAQGRWEGELERQTKDGRTVAVSAKMQLIRGEGGVDRVLETTRDVTQRKRAEQALLEADRRKDEFLGVLSHELRNPLAPICHAVHILEHAPPDGEQAKRAQRIIARQVVHLARLVDDLLDITRISNNKIALRRERLDLGELVRRTAEDHRSLFERSGVELVTEIPPEAVLVNGDATRLSQVVGNLLLNAIKFTARGGSARVSVTGSAAEGRAIVRVADTGAGMTPAMLERLFVPFMQADATLDRTKGGLGLGLALVKGLVELHGGEVAAASAGPGRGAEITVRLPLEEVVPRARPSARPSAPSRRRRVLIIEDNVDAADTLRDLLAMRGHDVSVTYDGPAGLAKAREVAPEVVLCDIGLPNMDGYAVARAFQSDASLRGALLVALSGYARPEDVQRARAAGFHLHVAKPLPLEQLEDFLEKTAAVGREVVER